MLDKHHKLSVPHLMRDFYEQKMYFSKGKQTKILKRIHNGTTTSDSDLRRLDFNDRKPQYHKDFSGYWFYYHKNPSKPPLCTVAHYYWILNPTANTVILHRDLPSKPSKDLLYRLLCWLWSTDTVMVDSVTLLGR